MSTTATIELFADLATTTVTSGGTTASSGSQTWTVASSASFPAAGTAPSTDLTFHVADTATGYGTEIIEVTNVAGTSWTVTRGAVGTSPVAHLPDFTIKQVVTGEFLQSPMPGIVSVYGTGDTSGSADTTAIQNALNNCPSGGIVQLATALYYTLEPVIVPPCVTLQGATFMYLWPDEYGTPDGSLAPQSQIIPVAAFSGDSVVKMVDESTGGYAAASGNQTINNITVNGENLGTATTVNGIEWYGSVIGCVLNECSVSAVTGHGYASVSHTGEGIGYGDLDQLAATNCVAYNCTGDGFHFNGLSDSVFVGCHSIGNTGYGWYSYLGNHNYFTNCKAEWSEGGWYIDVASGNSTIARMGFEGCSTDNNNGDGFYFTGNQTGGAVIMTGCILHADGHTGGTATSGIHISGAAYPILIDGCAVYIDVTDSGTNPQGPAYGLTTGSTPTLVTVTGSNFQGYTAAWNSDGTGTVYAGPNVMVSSGGAGTAPSTYTKQPPTGQNFGGLFGDGTDGSATLDGTATVAWASKSGSAYTLTRDPFLTSLTVDSGVTVNMDAYRVLCAGPIINKGIIQSVANAGGATGAAGSATTSGSVSFGKAGGAGTTGAGTAGTNAGNAPGTGVAGAGGSASTGAGGTGGTVTGATHTEAYRQSPAPFMTVFGTVAALPGSPGGGSGSGDGTNPGGGGGSGVPPTVLIGWSVVNSGTISSAGGAGGTPSTGNCGGGGGGGGGLILVYSLSAWTAGTTSVLGGAAGGHSGSGASGTAGSAGTVLNVVLQ